MSHTRQFVSLLFKRARSLKKDLSFHRTISRASGLSLHRRKVSNLGDIKACPCDYVPFLKSFAPMEISHWQKDINISHLPVIVGGGGLFSNHYFERQLTHVVRSRPRSLICWGAGQNTHDSTVVRFPEVLKSFDLVGVRDHNSPFDWVPCASCLDPAFDRSYTKEHEIVLYNHSEFRVLQNEGFPEMTNAVRDFGEVIAFLASGDTVITTSYHGAYWATLLGRRVIVLNPFSSKFFAFRHPPVLASDEDWRSALLAARSFPGALDECRQSNHQFAAKVLDRIT